MYCMYYSLKYSSADPSSAPTEIPEVKSTVTLSSKANTTVHSWFCFISNKPMLHWRSALLGQQITSRKKTEFKPSSLVYFASF